MIEKTVFISYRRKNVPWALAISQYLTHRGYDVFFDFISIGPGSFEKVITENIKARAHFLVLLAPSALERCDDPTDWLRREIELAMQHKRNIIPVMLEGFDFGAPDTVKYLTGPLETLNKYNGLNLPAEYFEPGMQKLCNQFLNVDLQAISHPVSKRTQKIVEKQKLAVTAAEPVSEETLTAQEWFEKGFQAKDLEEQIRLYTRAIELDGKNAYAYNNRGTCYDDLKQYERAIEDYNQAIKLNAKDAEIYNNRGVSFAKLKLYERAIENFDLAIKLNPKLALAYYNRGKNFSNLKQYERAIEDYDQAIKHNPQDAEAYNNRAVSYRNLHQYEKAIEDYDQAIKLNPESVVAYNNRGVSYAYLKQYERAFKDYTMAISLNPEFANAYYNKSCSYASMNNISEALQWLREALSREKERYCELSIIDSAFDAIREEPAFQQLLDEFCGCE